MNALDVRTVPADRPPATELVAEMVAELTALYGSIDRPSMPSARPEDFSAPHGSFVVLERDGAVVAGGGIKRLDDHACEFKRMYVRPEMRGQGLARHLLSALEDEARRLGYTLARLDTGPKQPRAQRLYETAGYAPIGNFNSNPLASFWGEKRLG